MTNDELDVHAKAWQTAADALFKMNPYYVDIPAMLKTIVQAVAEGYRQQKTPTP